MHTEINIDLLSLLKLVSHRGRVEPDNDKSQKSSNHRPKTGNPYPTASDSPTARVLVVRKVAVGDLMLLLDGGEEWTLVVDAEGEDTVLIRGHELSGEHSAGIGAVGGLEGQAVEGREHGELELERVASGNFEGNPLVIDVLGNLNGVDLQSNKGSWLAWKRRAVYRCFTYSLVLDPVDRGVQLCALSGKAMLDLVNLQDTSLLESPSSQLLSELAVHSGSLLAAGCLDGGREPLVLQ